MLPRIRSSRRDRFAKSLASRASPSQKTLNSNDYRTWDWPGGWPRVGQLASPWPIPQSFFLEQQTDSPTSKSLRCDRKNGDWLRLWSLSLFFRRDRQILQTNDRAARPNIQTFRKNFQNSYPLSRQRTLRVPDSFPSIG